MTTTLNAVTSTGLVQTSDGSGVLNIQSNGVNTNAQAWAQWSYASGSTCTVNRSYNVSSITVNGSTNDFTINFTNALPSQYYAIAGTGGQGSGNLNCLSVPAQQTAPSTTSLRVNIVYQNGNFAGSNTYNSVACFG